VSRCLRDDGFVKSLRLCKTKEEVWGLLDKVDGHSG
jgi:mannitol/fructose-specific phosphotransferase system IIA component (Ntr-type)